MVEDTAEDAEDSFGSGGDYFDDEFDPDPGPDPGTGGGSGTGGGGSGFDDDDDDSPLPDDVGEQNTIVGPDARGNPFDDPAIVDREAGFGGDDDGTPGRTEVDPDLQDDPGSAEAAQDAAAGDSVDETRIELSRRTRIAPSLEDDLGSAEAAQDALASGALGSPTRDPTSTAADSAADLAATGTLASQTQRRVSTGGVRASVNRFGQQQLDRESNELVGGTSGPEEAVRDLDEAAGELSEELGEGVAGVTNPSLDTSGFDDIAGDIQAGRAPRADEPVLSARPQEAPDNTGRNVAQVSGQAAGEVLFGTVPSAGVAAIEASEAGGALFGGVRRDVGELFNGDVDFDQTERAGRRVERAGSFAFERGVAQPARRTFETNPDAFDEVASQGRADEPLVSIEEGKRDEVSGAVIGAAAASGAAAPATAQLSPLRVTRFDVPTDDGGTTTVRAVRTRVPGVDDRTVATTVGGRPTPGAGSVDLNRVDLERLGGPDQRGAVFEPVGDFETELAQQSTTTLARQEPSERFSAISETMEIGDEASNEVRDLRGAIENTEDLPADADTDEIISALSDADATIFGSGAVRAQAPDFRDPGDIDIVVPDKEAAKSRLADAVGEDQVARAFDIKEPDDFAGLEEGEAFGFGRESRAPLETDEGVAVNPIGEELQRKAGASGFIRGEEVGNRRIDVGPRPNPGGAPRIKDPEDALAIARAVAGDDDPRVRQFERAFFGSDGEADVDRETLTAGLRDFLSDNRAQVQVGRQRPTRTFGDDTTDPELTTRESDLNQFFGDDSSTSPALRGDTDGSSLPVLSSSAAVSGAARSRSAGVFGSTTAQGSIPALGSVPASATGVSSAVPSQLTAAQSATLAGVSPATSGAPSVAPLGGASAPIFGSPTTSSPPGSSSPISSPPSTSPSPSPNIPPGTTSPPSTPQRRDDDSEQETEDESLFGISAQDEDFGTGIFTPGEDEPDFELF